MSEHGKKIARNAGVVAGATLVSRVLGFVRDVIVAFALGAGLLADAFFVAFRIPNLLRRLFGEGSLTMAFIPVYARVREEQGEEAAHAMARSAMIWLVCILGGITILAEVLAGPLTSAIAPGFLRSPEHFSVTVDLVRICFPYVIFICSVALCMGMLNAQGHFLSPALAPSVLNIALILSALMAYWCGWNVAYAMAFGVLAGGLFQFALQLPFLRRVGFRWRGSWSWCNPGVARMGLLMLPTIFGAAVYQLNIVLGTLLASYLPVGSVSYLYYADRLVQFPLGVFGIAVSTAALPSLSVLAAKNDMDGFGDALHSAMGLTLFIALPAAAGLLGLAEPLISVLFQRGAFSAEAVQATALALVAYSIGLPFIALSRPLVAAFYALEDTKTPVRIAVLCLLLNVALGVWLMGFLAHVGLAVAVSASSFINFVLLFSLLRARFGFCPVSFSAVFRCFILSSIIGFGAWFSGAWGMWGLALIPVWAVFYFVGAILLKLHEGQLLLGMVRSRLWRRRA